MGERPVLHCLIAKPLDDSGGLRFGRTTRVTLEFAMLAHTRGWLVVGPDPEDEVALSLWEREQRMFNKPRWWK